PRRYRIGWRSENHPDARLMKAIEDALHPGKLKVSILWLPTAPGGLPDSHDVNPGLAHQFDVSIEPLGRHVLRVICDAVEDRFHLVGREVLRIRCWLARTLGAGRRTLFGLRCNDWFRRFGRSANRQYS